MKKQEFLNLLKELNPSLVIEGKFLPQLAEETAIYCFLNQIENKEVQELRFYLWKLTTKGHFNFDDTLSKKG
jgi:hypothetical protein